MEKWINSGLFLLAIIPAGVALAFLLAPIVAAGVVGLALVYGGFYLLFVAPIYGPETAIVIMLFGVLLMAIAGIAAKFEDRRRV